MAAAWADLSSDERREQRFKRWLTPKNVKFDSPLAKQAYRERVTRFIKAFKLQEPDRVPCMLPAGLYAAFYADTNLGKVMYDYDEMRRAWLKFLNEFAGDTYNGPGMVPPGRALEALDYRLYKWPGHGLSPETLSYQTVEGEWMKADEYDALIKDPSNFWLRTYLPRVFGAFKAFGDMPPWTSFEEIAIMSLVPFGLPDVQAGFRALLKAGREARKWSKVVREVSRKALKAGFPAVMGGLAKAPFDTIGDTLRGTQGVIMDMFQRPDKLQEAIARITPLTIDGAIASADRSRMPMIMMPLHKGADGFMSPKQYETFYWPSLRQVIMALIEEGITPVLFAEGSYNTRLEVIKDLPRAKAAWYFDQTDMAAAKRILGDVCCIIGNVPTSLLMTGTPAEIKEHCRRLIEVCGKGGGYILAGGASIDSGNPDNLRAMMEAVTEYGVYK